jgi:hypothetical protein
MIDANKTVQVSVNIVNQKLIDDGPHLKIGQILSSTHFANSVDFEAIISKAVFCSGLISKYRG